ncbi:MAG: class I SAM-dependent RNA methyltransferase [Candidatus Promineifilaceae bacterium]
MSLELTIGEMAHGGAGIGRDAAGRAVFVPFVLPGERVEVELTEERPRYAHSRLLRVIEPAGERVPAPCPHFGPCGGCQYQHMSYAAQLRYKAAILRDQLERIGRLPDPLVRPAIPSPEPYAYRNEMSFSLAAEGQLGLWSPEQGRVIPIQVCLLIRPELLALYEDLDLELAGLRRANLRSGAGAELLLALEVDDLEPPALEADFPVSAALLLPDGTAANLIGDNYLAQSLNGRAFRVSAGCPFYPNPGAAEALLEVVLAQAGLAAGERLLELYSGVGALTAFLAPAADEVVCVEANPDAVADAAANLDDFAHISVYQGAPEAVLPGLAFRPDVVVLSPPPAGLPVEVVDELGRLPAGRLVYVSADAATLARDGRRLVEKGFGLVEAQPVDMFPQQYAVMSASLWERRPGFGD